MNLYFLDHPELSGVFNLGTGRAQSFNDVACAVVNACRRAQGQEALALADMQVRKLIEYASFPDALRGKYQHYTQADIGVLRRAGYDEPFLPVEDGVGRYCQALLAA